MAETNGSAKDFNVAIMGGGMCGLVCAVALLDKGVRVDLFESAAKFGEVGAGVGIGPNAIRALDGLGVLKDILARSEEREPTMRGFAILSGLPGHEMIYDYPIRPEEKGIGIHRPAFLEALVHRVDPSITHFHKRCTDVTHPTSDTSLVHFADGTTFEANVVIGADGIRSVVRGAVTQEPGIKRCSFTNNVAYRALVSVETLRNVGVTVDVTSKPLCWVGKDRHIITFPIQGNKTLNIVAFVTDRSVPPGSVEVPLGKWVQPVPEEELMNQYAGWDDQALAILSCMKKPSKWSIHSVDPPLDTFVSGRVALIGDAAHGMLPHLGAGAGQGFEDTLVLTRLLTHPQTKLANISDVLRAYDRVRVERANFVLRRSLKTGETYENYDRQGGYTAEEMREHLADISTPVWRYDIEKDISKGLDWLKELRTFA